MSGREDFAADARRDAYEDRRLAEARAEARQMALLDGIAERPCPFCGCERFEGEATCGDAECLAWLAADMDADRRSAEFKEGWA